MGLDNYFGKLRDHITVNPPNFCDGDSVLTMLYEAYADNNRMDDDTIKESFKELYRLMNGMTLTQMDTILDPVCTLCRDRERSGFVEGVKVGITLRAELTKK